MMIMIEARDRNPRPHARAVLTVSLTVTALVWLAGCTNGADGVEGLLPKLKCGRLSAPGPDLKACVPLSATGEDQEVTFDSQQNAAGKIQLTGTLTVPTFGGALPIPAKLPAVVLIADDGPLSRDGEVKGDIGGDFPAPVPLLKDLAGALSARGYVVLRYDKRTCTSCGYPEVIAQQTTWTDLVGDVVSAARYLGSMPNVDPSDLILIGHGQGATLALEAQAELKPSTLVLLAGNFDPIDKVLINQASWQIKTAPNKKVKDEAEKRLSEIESSMLAVRDGSFPAEYMVLGLHRAVFWKGWLDASRRISQSIESFRGPLLYMRGEDDLNVTPAEQASFEKLLEGRSNTQIIGPLPGTTHALHQSGGEPRITDEVSAGLVGWLSRGE